MKGEETVERKAERGRAVRGARVQDRRRPLRQAHLLPHLLGQAREGRGGLQLDQGPQGAHRPHPADARQPPRGHRRRRTRATSSPAVGFKQTTTGDTLCDRAHPIVLERMEFPEPVISVAIEPKTKVDQDKLGKALGSLSDEDPTFQVHTDDETGQTIIAGMGELHLEVLVDRMMREFNVDAQRRQAAGRVPRDDHRSRSRRSRSATSARPVAGASTATWSSRSSPPGPGGGYEFVDEIKGGVIPREYIPAVDAGIQEAMEGGVLAGYPLVDVRARLTFGSYHDVDSSRDGVQDRRLDGVQGRRPGRPSPRCSSRSWRSRSSPPEDYMGDVIGDLSSRRGQVEGMEQRGNAQVINAPGAARPRCSAMLPTFVRAPRGARRTRCSSTRTSRCRSRSPRRSSPESAASDHHVTPFIRFEGAEVHPWPRRSSSGTSRT